MPAAVNRSKFLSRKHLLLILVLGSLLILLVTWFSLPASLQTKQTSSISLNQEVEIEVWGWINKNNFEVQSNKDTPLTVVIKPTNLPFKHILRILPQDLLYPSSDYTFLIKTTNLLGVQTSKQLVVKTFSAPKVTLANPEQTNDKISAQAEFKFNIDPSIDAKFYTFSSHPSFEFEENFSKDTLLIKPTEKLIQGQTYRLRLHLDSDTLENPVLFENKVAVIDALTILSTNPLSGASLVPKQAALELVFNKAVKASGFESLVDVQPPLPINLTWSDDKTLKVDPKENWVTNTTYTFAISDEATGLDGSQLIERFALSFTTAGAVKVLSFSPSSYASLNSSITVNFDQPVDKNSAQAAFSISPSVEGTFSWRENSLLFKPISSLPPLTEYKIAIAPGVKSIDGEDSNQTFSSSFTTTNERVVTIGKSVKNRSITANYFGTGAKKILLVGSLHGSESNTGNMLSQWSSYLRANQKLIPTDKTFIIVSYANPDGRANGNRFNANNVDLNRNWGTPDWQALTYWQNNSYPSGGGSSAFSEPETVALRNLIQAENPTVIITYHAAANMILGDGIATSFGDWYASKTGYHRVAGNGDHDEGQSALGYQITGTLEEWASLRGIPTIVVEFISQTSSEYDRNLPALKGLLNYPF